MDAWAFARDYNGGVSSSITREKMETTEVLFVSLLTVFSGINGKAKSFSKEENSENGAKNPQSAGFEPARGDPI